MMIYLIEMHLAAKEAAAFERYAATQGQGGAWYWRFYAAHIVNILWHEMLRVLVCQQRGHDWEDTGSWAGPDSGGEDLTCRRCGSHYRHVYY